MNFQIIRTIENKDKTRIGLVVYNPEFKKYISFVIPKEAFSDERMPNTEEELNEQLKLLGFEA